MPSSMVIASLADSFYIDWLLAGLRKIGSLERNELSLIEKLENRLNHLVSSYLYGNALNSLVFQLFVKDNR